MTNVFVLCTGRCGSTSFIRAASHIDNFTAAHESRCHLTGPGRFAYPDRHIEADNRLSWLLARLDRAFGDRAHYVHLVRDPEATAQSLLKRADKGIMLAYRSEILMRATRKNRETPTIEFCRDFVDTVTENIQGFLRDKSRVITVHLETAEVDFPRFWDWIEATGDAEAASAEWRIRHNASPEQAEVDGTPFEEWARLNLKRNDERAAHARELAELKRSLKRREIDLAAEKVAKRKLRALLEEKHAALAAAQKEGEESQARLGAMLAYGRQLEKKHAELLASRTWRAMEPVRWLGRLLRGRAASRPFTPRLISGKLGSGQ